MKLPPPTHIEQRHWEEGLASGVEPELLSQNMRSLSGNTAYNTLLYSDKLARGNNGRLAQGILNRYQHIWDGGWWVISLDPLANWEEMEWGQFKPDRPINNKDGKIIKYEAPPKTPTRAIFPRITRQAWRIVAERASLTAQLPDLDTIPQTELSKCFWEWVHSHPQVDVTIIEGAKKAWCTISNGYVTIAIPGIYNGCRAPQDEDGNVIGNPSLIPELTAIATVGRRIIICFDNDTKVETIRNVNIATKRLGWLFVKAGCEVSVIKWVGKYPHKGVDDLIVNEGLEAYEGLYNSACSLSDFEAQNYKALTYEAYQKLNQPRLGELETPPDAKLICFASPKNTGKSWTLGKIAEKAIYNGQPILLLSHRVQLAQALADRLGIPYVTEIKSSGTGKSLGFALCVDSLHPTSQARFNADDPNTWSDALVIIDECEQVFWHLLNSHTCHRERVIIMHQLKQLLSNVYNGSGQIYLADADLSDLSIEYVQQMIGVKVPPIIYRNDYLDPDQYQVFNYTGSSPNLLLKELEEAISKGQKVLVHTGGQRWKSKFSTKNLEKRWNELFPHLRILRIDAESVATTGHPACGIIAHLNQMLGNYDIVIASPSIETGVSIDIVGHFNSVWGIFQGVQSSDSVRQTLMRLREPVDRHIWVASRGLDLIGDGSTNHRRILATTNKTTKLNIAALERADIDDIGLDFRSEHLNTWTKFSARYNFGQLRYREVVLGGLRSEGHAIIDIDDLDQGEDELKALGKELKAAAEQNRLDDNQQTTEVELITKDQREKLKTKKEKTDHERKLERKYDVHNRYGEVDVTTALLMRDEDGWYPQIRLHYYLTMGREFLKPRDNQKYESQKENGGIFNPDFNRSQYSAPVLTMERLGIGKLLEARSADPNLELRNGEGIASEIGDKVRSVPPHQIKSLLGLTIDQEDSDIEIVRALLGKLDLSLRRIRQVRVGDKRVGVFGINAISVSRAEILASNPIYQQVGLDKLLDAWDNEQQLQLRNGEGLAKEIGDNVRANPNLPNLSKASDIKIISKLLDPFYINVRCCQKIEHRICDLLVRLGIYDLVADWANGDEIIELRHGEGRAKEIGELARSLSKEVKSLLGLTISQSDTDINIVSKLVGKAGLKTHRVRRERVDHKRIGIYQLVGGLEELTDADGEPISHILDHHIFFATRTEKIYTLCPTTTSMGTDNRADIFQRWATKDAELVAELSRVPQPNISAGVLDLLDPPPVNVETVAQELAAVGNEVDLFSLIEQHGRRLCGEAAQALKAAKNRAYFTIKTALAELKNLLGEAYEQLPA